MSLIYKAVGSGGDFANPKLALEWIDAQSPKEQYILDIISDITWAAGPDNFFYPDNADSSLKITCSHNILHRDDHTQWYKLTCTDSYPALFMNPYFYWALCEIEFLKFVDCNGYCVRFGHYCSEGSGIRNCIFFTDNEAISSRYSQCWCTIANCLMYGEGTIIHDNFGGTVFNPPTPRRLMYNCIIVSTEYSSPYGTIFWQTLSSPGVLSVVFRNNYCFHTDLGNEQIDFKMGTGNGQYSIDYCASGKEFLSDAGSHCIPNIDWMDVFKSVNVNSSEFLKPKDGNPIGKAGIAPALLQDISGTIYRYPYPIGAYQYIDQTYINLIPEQLRQIYGGLLKGKRTNFVKEIQAFVTQVWELIETAALLKAIRSIDAALQYGIDQAWPSDKNPILDDIGDIIGQPRYNQNNAEYAISLRAKIFMNASRGEPERIISAIRSICQTEIIRYYEYYPASIVVEFECDTVPEGLNATMQKVKSGGVLLDLIESSETDAFAFSDDGTLGTGDTVHGFAPTDQSSGGKFSSIIS